MNDLSLSVLRLLRDGLSTFAWSVSYIGLASFAGLSLGFLPMQVAEGLPIWGVLALLPLFILVLGWALFVLFNQRRRRQLFLRLMRDGALGWTSPLVVAGLVSVFALSVFSVTTLLLHDLRLLDLSSSSVTAGRRLELQSVWNFYTWHLLRAIPLLDVNQSLHWEAPLVYRGALTGWMVIAFRAAVIVPLIQAIRTYWQVSGEAPRIRVRTWAWRRVAPSGSKVTINWAPAPPPPGFVFVVKVKCPRPAKDSADATADEGEIFVSGTTYPSRNDVEVKCPGPGWNAEDAKTGESETLVSDTTDTSAKLELRRPGRYRFWAACREDLMQGREVILREAIMEAYGWRERLTSREVGVLVRPVLPDSP